MDTLAPISMNVKHKRMTLSQTITAIAIPTVLTLREVSLVNVEMVTQEMGSLVEARSSLHITSVETLKTENHQLV